MLEFAHWFWRRRFFFNFVNVHVFSLFRYHLSGKAWCPSSEQTLIPITQECFVPSLFEIAPVVLGENILKFVNDLPLFRYYLPLEKERGLHLNKIDFPLPKDFVPNLVEISQVVLEKKIFKISLIYFRYFVIISLFKRAGPFIWKNLNPLHPRMLCGKFGWNWPCVSGEEDF